MRSIRPVCGGERMSCPCGRPSGSDAILPWGAPGQRHVLVEEPRPIAVQQLHAIADLAVLQRHVGQRDELVKARSSVSLKARSNNCTSSIQTSPWPIRSKRTCNWESPSSGRSSTWNMYWPQVAGDGHAGLAAGFAAGRWRRSGSSRGRQVSLPRPAAGAAAAASATRIQTDIDSRPVAGGSNERLTRQATGPSLEMRTDCAAVPVCELSSCTADAQPPGDGPAGDRIGGGGRALEVGVVQHPQRQRRPQRGGPEAELVDVRGQAPRRPPAGSETCGLDSFAARFARAWRPPAHRVPARPTNAGRRRLAAACRRARGPARGSSWQPAAASTPTSAVTAKGASLTA